MRTSFWLDSEKVGDDGLSAVAKLKATCAAQKGCSKRHIRCEMAQWHDSHCAWIKARVKRTGITHQADDQAADEGPRKQRLQRQLADGTLA